MTRGSFQSALVDLLTTYHPDPPATLSDEVRHGVERMIAAAVRSAGDDGLQPEVIYAIRASKLAARLLPPDVYRDPNRRGRIKASIRTLIRTHLTSGSIEN